MARPTARARVARSSTGTLPGNTHVEPVPAHGAESDDRPGEVNFDRAVWGAADDHDPLIAVGKLGGSSA